MDDHVTKPGICNRRLPGAALCLLIIIFGGMEARAEAAYIDDTLRVGVRPEPNNQVAPKVVIKTGAELEVLESNGNYSLIRTSDGIEGWIRSLYISDTMPAKTMLSQIKNEYSKAKSAIDPLRDENSRLQKEVKALNSEIQDLEQKLATLDPRDLSQWLYLALFVVALSMLSFSIGIVWHKQQVAKRLGGHTL